MIILGGLAGGLSSLIAQNTKKLFLDVSLGILGAIAGGLIMNNFGGLTFTSFNITSLIIAGIGAIFLILLGRFLSRTPDETYYQ